MRAISRRQFQLGLSALIGTAVNSPAFAQHSVSSSRVAIIDTDDDIRTLLLEIGDDPTNRGLQIVARYYARQCQPGSFPYKRFALNQDGYRCGDNRWKGAAEHEILFKRGLAILSTYQFNNSSPSKFLFGLSDVQDAIRKSRKPESIAAPEAEAEADADAVAEQSKTVQQPEQSAVYFGVDFDLRTSGQVKDLKNNIVKDRDGRPVQSQRTIDAVLVYFSRLKELLGDRLGAYGNGYINRVLREQKLIRYSWISKSRSFMETPEFLAQKDSSLPWHLFQNQIDRRWSNGFSLDTNVQNPTVTNIGAWNAQGAYEVPPSRTQEIFKKRWVALRDNIPVLDSSGRLKPLKGHAGLQRNRSVHITNDLGDFVEVDIDDDGKAEGVCRKIDPESNQANFAESIFAMPRW